MTELPNCGCSVWYSYNEYLLSRCFPTGVLSVYCVCVVGGGGGEGGGRACVCACVVDKTGLWLQQKIFRDKHVFVCQTFVVTKMILLAAPANDRNTQGSRRDQKILEEGGGAGPQLCPEEIMSREVELG